MLLALKTQTIAKNKIKIRYLQNHFLAMDIFHALILKKRSMALPKHIVLWINAKLILFCLLEKLSKQVLKLTNKKMSVIKKIANI